MHSLCRLFGPVQIIIGINELLNQYSFTLQAVWSNKANYRHTWPIHSIPIPFAGFSPGKLIIVTNDPLHHYPFTVQAVWPSKDTHWYKSHTICISNHFEGCEANHWHKGPFTSISIHMCRLFGPVKTISDINHAPYAYQSTLKTVWSI